MVAGLYVPGAARPLPSCWKSVCYPLFRAEVDVRATIAVLLSCWSSVALAGAVTGRVGVLDKGGKPAGDLQDTVVWVDDIKAKPKAPPARATITMKGKAFVPRVTVIPIGATVDFPNQDPILHNVFSVSGENRFDLDLYKRPKSGSWVFQNPGIVRVYCNIHPQMNAVVMVRDNPFFTKAGTDGSFRLEGVPAGKHVLKAWHERGGESSTEVIVPAGEGQVSAELQLDASKFKKAPHKRKDGTDYGTGEQY